MEASRFMKENGISASGELEAQPNQLLLRIYNNYRLTIALLLVLMASSGWHKLLLEVENGSPFLLCSWLYLLSCVVPPLLWPNPKHLLQVLAMTLADVLLLCLLCYTAGGTANGFGNFLLVSVGLANLLVGGRLGLFIASVGALGLLVVTFYLNLATEVSAQTWLQVGILGMLCFAAALFSQGVAQRMRRSEALAEQRAQDVASLEALNAQILQRMHTGILLLDEQQRVLLANAESERLFGLKGLAGKSLSRLSSELMDCLVRWQENPVLYPRSVQLRGEGALLQPGFMLIHWGGKRHSLIFLENLAKITQQAQQIKLAALGRLSAAIAHEIRNPLGAISHAAQLLLESQCNCLQGDDLRFANIIQRQAQRLNQSVENVLQLSRPRELQAQPRSIELGTWLHEFICEYRSHLPQGQRLHFQRKSKKALRVLMEPSQLHQVLSNLLQNALRYSERKNPGSAQVWLRLYCAEGSGQPVLDVLDDGEGVAQSEQEYLFEPFYSTESKGTGLGLYVARELCELNRARLDWLPREGGGSCMRISFTRAHPVECSNA